MLMHTKDISHRSTNKDKPNCCPDCWLVYKTAKSLKAHLTTYCKRKSSQPQVTDVKSEDITIKGKMGWGLSPEEGELSDDLEEGKLKILT